MSGLCKLGQVVDGTTDDPKYYLVCIPRLTEEEVQFLKYENCKTKIQNVICFYLFPKNGLKKLSKKL